METKWTRGPWAARRIGPPTNRLEIFAGGGNGPAFPIATVYEDPPPFATKGERERKEAVARLIAAAPELAEALADLVALINAGCSADVIRDGKTFKRARQALEAAGIEV